MPNLHILVPWLKPGYRQRTSWAAAQQQLTAAKDSAPDYWLMKK